MRTAAVIDAGAQSNGACRADVYRDLSRKATLLATTIAPAAVSLSGLAWPTPRRCRSFPSSRRQCRNYPLRPPGPSERCLAIAPYLEPSKPSPPLRHTLFLPRSHPFSLLSPLFLSFPLLFSLFLPTVSDCPTHPPLPVSTAPTPVPRSPSTFSPRLAGVQSSQRL